ncbi:MAG TPA: hypothetical protein DEP60_06005 [Ruminococcaceae bacterium]|nr:hypothetical protein [Oscillospiraceae bacterium]
MRFSNIFSNMKSKVIKSLTSAVQRSCFYMINPVSFESVYRSAYSQNAYQASKISHLPAAQKSVPASDKICISTVGSLQQTAAKAAAAVGNIPLPSSQRLSALRQQIQDGTYQISAADVAASMLRRSFSSEA